jgi:fused signal recognition particle receptor
MESDVALPVIEEIKGKSAKPLGKRVDRKYSLDQVVESALRTAIEAVLKKSEFDFDGFIKGHERPIVIMFVGINGTGKTTAIAKLAHRLQGQGLTTVLSASDTFRAGAIEQLTVHSENLGTKIIKHQREGTPRPWVRCGGPCQGAS